MRFSFILKFLLFFLLFHPFVVQATTQERDSLDSAELPLIEVETKRIQGKTFSIEKQPIILNVFDAKSIEQLNATTAKDLSQFTPNFYMPDYGSQMTSSIYVRGSGARIDQPVVGFLINGTPILNKNNFDFEMYDLQSVSFLKGPQGTIYGRNTLGGLILMELKDPFLPQETTASVDYSTGNTIQIKASTRYAPSRKFAFSFSANAKHTDGYFINDYNGKLCDPSNSINLHSQQRWILSKKLEIENMLLGGVIKQGGYAYRPVDSTGIHPVNYNEECHYKRISLVDGLSVRVRNENFIFESNTSYQYLNDDMFLDNDFTPQPIFTLNQRQNEHVITEDLYFSSNQPYSTTEVPRIWQWKSGLSAFYKLNNMTAPVVFGKAGVNDLILDNANKGLQTVFPNDRLEFKEEELPINCEFKIPGFGVAAHHHSEFHLKKWIFAAGLRIDYENAKMEYQNEASLHYMMTLFSDEFYPFTCNLNGTAKKSFFEFLPKVSVQYYINKENQIYAKASKGYKAGGFNTQIFSDLLQKKLKDDLMSDMGMAFDDNSEEYDVEKAISYDPEYNWTYELGGKFIVKKRDTPKLKIDIAAFYVRTENQQLTVFPPGKNTGRMMTNAGKSRSLGGELSLDWMIFKNKTNSLFLGAAYGYTNAKFVKYHDGNHDYSGKYVPFAPQNTAVARLNYTISVNKKLLKSINLFGSWKGTGKIYWDEQNRTSQPFYSVFDASVAFETKYFTIKGWCKNLGDKEYETFRFTSIGNQFCQIGKPRQIGISLKYCFNPQNR